MDHGCEKAMKSELSNEISSSFNYSVNQTKKILLSGMRDMCQLNDADKKVAIKIYLSYLICKYNVPVTSVTELQVFLYQLSINIKNNKLDTVTDNSERIGGLCVGSVQYTNDESRHNINCKSANKTSNHIVDVPRYRFGNKSNASSTVKINERLLIDKYKNDVPGYLKKSEQALDIAVSNFVDKLLAVIMDAPTLADDKNSLYKLLGYFYNPRQVSLTKKYDLISKYHKKGLFVLECKKLYMKELLKDAL